MRRWGILALLFSAILINILDRQVLSLAAPVIREEFGLSNTQYGAILFLFLLGMTVGQIPAGRWIDRAGARIGFAVIVTWWSAANLAHAFARSFASFGVFRFLLGVGECGAYSGGIKVIGQWFAVEQRALAGGLFNSGSLAGAVIAPPLIVAIMGRYGWPAAFLIPSLFGFLWLIPWLLVYRDPPVIKDARPPTAPEYAIRALLRRPEVWGVVLMRTFGGPVSHFYWYWLPEYLRHGRGMSMEQIGQLAWLPFFVGGLGNIVGGWFSSALIRRGWRVDRARNTAFLISVALCMAAVLVPAAPNAGLAIAMISIAAFGISSVAANLIGLLTDLFPPAVLAKVTGMTGVGDGAMSMLMMLAAGIVIDRLSYVPVFIGVGTFPLLSLAALFLLVRRTVSSGTNSNANPFRPPLS